MARPPEKLDLAAGQRVPCRLGRVEGAWITGQVVDCGDAGVIVDAPDHDLRAGEEVRIWFELEGERAYYEASVARVGAPVPGRGAGGIVLDDLYEILAPEGATSDGSVVEILLPGGAAISLLGNPGRLIDIVLQRIDFELPRVYPVVFPEGGPLRMRLASLAEAPCELRGHVVRVVPGADSLLYTVHVDLVERADLHRRLVSRLGATLLSS